jgi:excisionase family DNA binding protein
MALTLGQAAKHLGVSKPTISKAISSGKLSATRLDDKSFAIDPAELERYKAMNGHRFPVTQKETPASLRVETPPETSMETALQLVHAEARAKLAEERLTDLKAMLDEMRSQRDAWQKQAEGRLLVDQRPVESGNATEQRRRGWFGWRKAG